MDKGATRKEPLEVLGIFGIFSIASSVFLLGYQAFFWLRNGYWQKIPVLEIIPSTIEDAILRMEWLGVRKILLWTFDCELASFLFVMGLVLIFISIWAAEWQRSYSSSPKK